MRACVSSCCHVALDAATLYVGRSAAALDIVVKRTVAAVADGRAVAALAVHLVFTSLRVREAFAVRASP